MNCCGLLSRDTFDMGLIYAPDFFMKLMKQGKNHEAGEKRETPEIYMQTIKQIYKANEYIYIYIYIFTFEYE